MKTLFLNTLDASAVREQFRSICLELPVRIHLPCLDIYGEPVVFDLSMDDEGFFVLAGGWNSLNALDINDCPLCESRPRQIRRICRRYGVLFDDDRLVLRCRRHELSAALFCLLDAIDAVERLLQRS